MLRAKEFDFTPTLSGKHNEILINGFKGKRVFSQSVDMALGSKNTYLIKGSRRPELPVSFSIYYVFDTKTWIKKAHNQRSAELLQQGFECLRSSLKYANISVDLQLRMVSDHHGNGELALFSPHFGTTIQGLIPHDATLASKYYNESYSHAVALYREVSNSGGKHLFPADPNPGNIILLPDDKFLFIDFEVRDVWRNYSDAEEVRLRNLFRKSAQRWKLAHD